MWVAPASRASSSFAEARSTATTSVHPMSRIHWMAKRPIGPQPTTAPRWPIVGGAFQTACKAMEAGSVIAIARGSAPEGAFRRLATGVATNSA